MKIVTTGCTFLDIDGYAGCIVYAELLRSQGIEAQAVSTAPLNESITATVLSWNGKMAQTYQPNKDDTFAIIDVSEPHFFDTFVDLKRVDTVIDHHVGCEDYWQERIGDAADIEFIGAACTQVYEHWARAGKFHAMSATSARLLMTGILDNTLCFRAKVTTDRDRAAYEAMAAIAGLPEDWPAMYFAECQLAIEARLTNAILNDTKSLSEADLAKYHHLIPVHIGQLVIWDARELLNSRQSEIEAAMHTENNDWLINVVSIDEGVSYIVAKDPSVQTKITKLLGLQGFEGGYAPSDRLWLRKEILKAALGTLE